MNSSTCPFKIGDIVRFSPSDYALAKLSALELYGILPNAIGQVVRIEHGRYVYLENSAPGMGLDWEMFVLIERKNERSSP